MSVNNQVPFLYTLNGGDAETLTITNAKSISVMTTGASTTIQNSATQIISLPDGATIELNADSGNTLSNVTISPEVAGVAYVVMIGGNGIITAP
jgi:hypothetical protein